MNRVVVDASALAALVFDEPEAAAVAKQLEGATVFAPTLLKFELANTALKKARRHKSDAARVLAALSAARDSWTDISWREVDVADVALVAHATGLSAYDASYLWLAGSLGADLVTLDRRLAKAADAI